MLPLPMAFLFSIFLPSTTSGVTTLNFSTRLLNFLTYGLFSGGLDSIFNFIGFVESPNPPDTSPLKAGGLPLPLPKFISSSSSSPPSASSILLLLGALNRALFPENSGVV